MFNPKLHDDVIKLKHFRVTGPLWGESNGHRWIRLNGFLSQRQGQSRGTLMYAWTNGLKANNGTPSCSLWRQAIKSCSYKKDLTNRRRVTYIWVSKLGYHLLHTWMFVVNGPICMRTNFSKFESIYVNFDTRKCTWRCCLQGCSHFVNWVI